jgi:TrmH family RNA methyltransferase
MITSSQNRKIKLVRQLQESSRAREQEKAFVIEGVRLAEEALASKWPAHFVLYTQELSERGQEVLEGFVQSGVQVEETTPSVLRSASDTHTPQGLLAVLQQTTLPIPDTLDFLVLLDGLRDPGNVGTVLRCASAAGAQAVGMTPGSVDAFSPKVLRSGMGAHFHLPVRELDWEMNTQLVRQHHLRVFLAEAGEGNTCFEQDFRQPLALIIGGEAAGSSQEAYQLAHARVNIPMPGPAESLNAASAAAVLIFEVVRQRHTSVS